MLVPFSAVSNNTQIRWRQPSTVNGNDWAIDDIYYGENKPDQSYIYASRLLLRGQSNSCYFFFSFFLSF